MAAKPPRQPKLRSSCDGCGAAKLKCDRRQPACGRCIDLGVTCIYGVSRKMGKPPRDKLQLSKLLGKSSVDRRPESSSAEIRKLDDGSLEDHRHRRPGSDVRLSRESGASSIGSNDQHSTRGSVNGDDFSNLGASTINSSILDAFPTLTNFVSMDLDDWSLTDGQSTSNMNPDLFATFEWPELDSTATPPSPPASYLRHHPDGIGNISMPFGDDCNCLRETHQILQNLSLINPNKTPTPVTSGPLATPVSNFPLDYVLNLNRECVDHLTKLLNCSCGGSPHLGLLHASIISQILMWYHQESTSWTSSRASHFINQSLADDTSQPGSGFPSSSTWSGSTLASKTTTTRTGGTNTPTQSAGPAQMAMGTFIIDDERVQCALRIQLLLAELAKIGSLITAFSARSLKASDISASGTVDPLYKSLGSWLSKEHSSIVDILRSRLREISI